MFQIANVKFSNMKNKPIVDSKGDKIGRIIDFHFTYTDGKMKFSSIVMGGSRIEEFLESIGAKKDIDPFFPIDIIDKYGPDSIGILTSAKMTNEENYLAQKFARAVIGTNNVDHCARL